MTPAIWIALAYGIVAITLLAYVTRLRRRLRVVEHDVRARAARVRPPSLTAR